MASLQGQKITFILSIQVKNKVLLQSKNNRDLAKIAKNFKTAGNSKTAVSNSGFSKGGVTLMLQ